MKGLSVSLLLIMFFAAFDYYDSSVVCAQQSSSNEKCCCKFRAGGRDTFNWIARDECERRGGSMVMFMPAKPGTSPEAMCRGIRGPR